MVFETPDGHIPFSTIGGVSTLGLHPFILEEQDLLFHTDIRLGCVELINIDGVLVLAELNPQGIGSVHAAGRELDICSKAICTVLLQWGFELVLHILNMFGHGKDPKT